MSRLTASVLRQALAIITLTAAAGWGVAATAAPGDMQRGMHTLPGVGPLAGRGLARMLDEIGATAEQRAQLAQIAAAARADLAADRDTGPSLREQAVQLFTQPTVDADAAEALRQQMLARQDRHSQRMMAAMLEVSRVLTPEQRQQWAQTMQARHARMKDKARQHDHHDPARRDGQPQADPATR